jgi:hypothetical protein
VVLAAVSEQASTHAGMLGVLEGAVLVAVELAFDLAIEVAVAVAEEEAAFAVEMRTAKNAKSIDELNMMAKEKNSIKKHTIFIPI